MSQVLAVVLASIAVVATTENDSALAPDSIEPREATESRQPDATTTVQEAPAAVVPPTEQNDSETATQRFRRTTDNIKAATTAYYQRLQWNAVAMQSRNWPQANRIPPGVQESLNTLPLDSLPEEFNRIKDDPRIPPDDRRKLTDLWTLFSDLKKLVDDPQSQYGGRLNYRTLTIRFNRIVENKPAAAARLAEKPVERKTSDASAEPDPFVKELSDRIAAAKKRLAMAESYQNELLQVQEDAQQNIKRVEQQQLEVERQISNQQFERWLQGTPPRQEGEELVKRSRTKRIAARRALNDGNTQLSERLFWDAADAAMRASNIDQTHQSGEVAVRLVIDEYRGCAGPDHDPVDFVRRINNRQFDLWLVGQSLQQQGTELVRRCDQILSAAEHAFKNGNTQYGEVLLWDAADVATRASGIDKTQRLGEFAVKRVLEAFRARTQREVAPVRDHEPPERVKAFSQPR